MKLGFLADILKFSLPPNYTSPQFI